MSAASSSLFSLPAVESAAVTTSGLRTFPVPPPLLLSGLVVETTASELLLKLGCRKGTFLSDNFTTQIVPMQRGAKTGEVHAEIIGFAFSNPEQSERCI